MFTGSAEVGLRRRHYAVYDQLTVAQHFGITPRQRLITLIARICSYLLLALALSFTMLTIVIPKFGGAVPVTILSDSMAPAMPVGSLAIIKPISPLDAQEIQTRSPEKIRAVSDYSRLGIGDIVAYQPDPRDATLVIHRITEVSTQFDGHLLFTTKGDNNRVADHKQVADFQIRGVVWYHLPPPIGTMNTHINHDPVNHFIAVVVVVAALYLWSIALFWRAFRRKTPLIAGPATPSLPPSTTAGVIDEKIYGPAWLITAVSAHNLKQSDSQGTPS